MEGFFNNKSFIQILVKWRIHLAIILVLSAATGVLVSSKWVITPLYKSVAVVYPVNIAPYSEESETEQMLQLFRSTDIKLQMLDAFQLDKHYKLPRNTPSFLTYYMAEYDDHISISKTEYESVEIKVLDKDPQVASDMVDSIIHFYNLKAAQLFRNKQHEMIVIASNQLAKKKAEMDSIENILKNLRTEYGILDYATQSKEVTKEIVQPSSGSKANDLFSALKEKGGEFRTLDSLFWAVRKDYIKYKEQKEGAEREFNKDITYAQIITQPFPADKKAYPIRWLIVLLTSVSGLLFALIAIAFIESFKKSNS